MASIYKRNGRGAYVIAYFDHIGMRREKSSRTTDKRAAERIAAKLEADSALRREGVVDAKMDHFTAQDQKPLTEHLQDYLAHCEHVGMDKKTRHMKKAHIEALIDRINADRMSDLEPNVVERHLHVLRQDGRSARTVNHNRSDVVAFVSWCVKTGRMPSNPLSIVPKLDERMDRRRVRRALSDDELIWLLGVASEQDQANGARFEPRHPVYLTAAMTGLRRNELAQLLWSDIDLDTETLRLRATVGKSNREDTIPLHRQIVDILRAMKPEDARQVDRVFTTMPTILTFYKDLDRARGKWIAQAQDQAEREHREKSDFLAKQDAEGRVVDLHAMRTTLGTNLARYGVRPQLAQRLMRHSDYRTTLKHYTVLGLADTAAAIHELPAIGVKPEAVEITATGTDGATADHQQIPQQSEHESMRDGATQCDDKSSESYLATVPKYLSIAEDNDDMRLDATLCDAMRESG